MSKSYGSMFTNLVRGILKDLASIDPSLTKGFARDLVTLASLIRKHGDSVFFLSFPETDKKLCQSLDSEFLSIEGSPYFGRINGRTKIPRLFQGIWKNLFTDGGFLKSDADPTFVAALRNILCCGSKLRVSCSPQRQFSVIKEFYDTESQLPLSPLLWDSDGCDLHRDACGSLYDYAGTDADRDTLFREQRTTDLLALVQRTADRVIGHDFGIFNPESCRFKHGPGATAESGRGKRYKYDFPSWSPRLDVLFPFDAVGVANSAVLAGACRVVWEETHSRLISVPKTHKGPRLIAAEPTCHQWVQQGIAEFINSSLLRRRSVLGRCIDFKRQDLSGREVVVESRRAYKATIDLKSASDRLTTWVVQRVFRINPGLLGAIVACRTRFLDQELDKKHPRTIRLRKFATMGSALTFPIQSIVFTILALSAGLAVEPRRRLRSLAKEVRVYGDDVIIPVAWVGVFRQLLKALWLEINEQKTFSGKNFRESCGVDAFRGYDVTPVRIKAFPDRDRPAASISLVESSNLLHMKGFWHAAKEIQSLVPLGEIPVVGHADGIWGAQTFSKGVFPYKRKYDPNYQSTYVTLIQPKAVKKTHARFEGAPNLLQYFTEDPSPEVFWESGQTGTFEAGLGRRRVPTEFLSLAD